VFKRRAYESSKEPHDAQETCMSVKETHISERKPFMSIKETHMSEKKPAWAHKRPI
jgi:hypothetical protein